MKKKLITILLTAGLITSLVAGEVLNKGVDFTGVTSLTPTKLNNIVDNAYPASHIGFVVVTNNTPSAALTTMTNFIWLDSSAAPYTIKTWNTSSNAWVANSGIGAGAIGSTELAAGSVVSGKLAANSVWSTNINDNNIIEAKIQAGAVTTTKIASGNVVTDSIATDAITSLLITNSAVTSAKIAAAAVTSIKVAADAIRSTNIIDGEIVGADIAANVVTNSHITTDAIRSTNIVDGAIATVDLEADILFEKFTSTTNNTLSSINTGGAHSYAHGLTATPQSVRAVLVCGTTDAGWAVGDEINVEGFYDDNGANAFHVHADGVSGEVRIVRGNTAGNIKLHNKTTGVTGNLTAANWSFRVYAVYFK